MLGGVFLTCSVWVVSIFDNHPANLCVSILDVRNCSPDFNFGELSNYRARLSGKKVEHERFVSFRIIKMPAQDLVTISECRIRITTQLHNLDYKSPG